jgi:hypothetical protein
LFHDSESLFNYVFSRIGYSPNSPFLKDVIINALKSPSTPVGYNNKAELDAAIDNHISFCFVIQFNDELSGALDNKNLPSNLDITIRLPSEIGDSKNEWFTNILYPMSQTPGPREPENGYGGDPGTLSQN